MNQLYRYLLVLTILLGCAGQRPPEGGPVDAIPPEVISVFPSPNTVNYTEKRIIIEFSEYVDRRLSEEAIFISPTIEGKEFDWSGTELEITFDEELRVNTTYVVTIGTDVTDVRAGNRMAKAFSVSFSTGERIDNGSITGKVFDDNPDGVLIYSYRLNNILADTLNPSESKPDYLTQAGKNGEFTLKNLAFGTYRLIAVKDEYRNLLYEPEIDAAGTSEDVTLTDTDTVKSGMNFILAKTDTTAPTLSTVQSVDDHHLLVQFNEPLDSLSVTKECFGITDTLFQKSLSIRDFFFTNATFDKIMLITEQQQKDELYLLSIHSIRDQSGFKINPSASAKQFTASALKDTVPPLLIGSPMNNPSVTILPNDQILLSFSDALRQPIVDSSIFLKRGKDSSIISINLLFRGPAALTVIPRASLPVGEQLFISIRPHTLSDLYGNVNTDSSLVIRFGVENPENYGSIEGSAAGFAIPNTVVVAKNINTKTQENLKSTIDSSGKFAFTRLPEGQYTLKMIDDVNGNRTHDAGDVFPFVRGERFSYYKDTIRVRARWPVDGVKFLAK